MFRMPRKLAMARAHVVSEMEHVHARAYHVLRDLASACSRIFDCTRRPILGNVEEFHSDIRIDGSLDCPTRVEAEADHSLRLDAATFKSCR